MTKRTSAVVVIGLALVLICCVLWVSGRVCDTLRGPSYRQLVGEYTLEGWRCGHGTLLLKADGTFEQVYVTDSGSRVRSKGSWEVEHRGWTKAVIHFTDFIMLERDDLPQLHKYGSVRGMDAGWFCGRVCFGLFADGRARYIRNH